MKHPSTKRSMKIFLAALLGLAFAGILLTSCVGEGTCSRTCPQCEGNCEKTSGHSSQHECNFCGWHWY